jgi:PAS domain S-box-containing protein
VLGRRNVDVATAADYDDFTKIVGTAKRRTRGRVLAVRGQDGMSETGSLLIFLNDPRLIAHATSHCPAWLWSADATRVLWSNPTGAAIFAAPTPAALAGNATDPNGSAALQIARIAGTLSHGAVPRLERLRGFGGRFGGALLCSCSRIMLADRVPAILVVATEPAGPRLPLDEQARRLLAGVDDAVALFAATGALLHATRAALTRLGGAATLDSLGARAIAGDALAAGRAAGETPAGAISLARLGADASAMLLASFAPPAVAARQPVEPAAPPAAQDSPVTALAAQPAPPEPHPPAVQPSVPSAADERRQPLRFVWQMDLDGHFALDSEEFLTLLGPRTVAALDQPWNKIAATLGLDPEGQVARAFASHDTWSGITVAMPVDGADRRLAVELSGLPVFDRDRKFRGYRGFGICRDTARVAELARERRAGPPTDSSTEAPARRHEPAGNSVEPALRAEAPLFREERPALSVVPPSENVVPFRASAQEKSPTLTAVERKAFSELASRLTARLRSADQARPQAGASEELPAPLAEPAAMTPRREQPDGRVAAGDQRPILDRLPVGVLVYRLDRLIYANRAFLDWTGYGELHALEEAGGLDALFVEPSANTVGEKNGSKALTIATNRGDQLPVEARLFTSPWEGESALVLMLANVGGGADRQGSFDTALREAKTEAAELRAILDAATDGVVVFDREGSIVSINRGAELMFGYESRELAGLPFPGLFAPDSQRLAIDYLVSLQQPGAARVRDAGREVIGRGREGGALPLFMKIGRIEDGSDRLCAVLRDITSWKKAEAELVNARRQAESASSAKSDFLAKVSHEIRTPLNAIIGFAEVMMQERFGAIGNDRYKQYLGDIHSSGGYLISLLNDLLDLSKIEAGKLELNLAAVDLNVLTQQCVALMQPQANRERIIIRTALAQPLQPVTADARSVRQIVLNLLSNSIKFTAAGGQVIVSTAQNDAGDVVLRVRDTGVGMSEQELAIALEPFRQLATSDRFGSGGTGLGLPLTKALAEANRANFSIKSAVNNGTLVEVAFPGAQLAAE